MATAKRKRVHPTPPEAPDGPMWETAPPGAVTRQRRKLTVRRAAAAAVAAPASPAAALPGLVLAARATKKKGKWQKLAQRRKEKKAAAKAAEAAAAGVTSPSAPRASKRRKVKVTPRCAPAAKGGCGALSIAADAGVPSIINARCADRSLLVCCAGGVTPGQASTPKHARTPRAKLLERGQTLVCFDTCTFLGHAHLVQCVWSAIADERAPTSVSVLVPLVSRGARLPSWAWCS